jgi:hypothetical protein
VIILKAQTRERLGLQLFRLSDSSLHHVCEDAGNSGLWQVMRPGLGAEKSNLQQNTVVLSPGPSTCGGLQGPYLSINSLSIIADCLLSMRDIYVP